MCPQVKSKLGPKVDSECSKCTVAAPAPAAAAAAAAAAPAAATIPMPIVKLNTMQ